MARQGTARHGTAKQSKSNQIKSNQITARHKIITGKLNVQEVRLKMSDSR